MLELKWFVRLSDFKVDVHSKPPSLEPASLPAATKRSKERAHSVDNVSRVIPVYLAGLLALGVVIHHPW